jgi:hypothetical protein
MSLARFSTLALTAAVAASSLDARLASAQTVTAQTDSRWIAWLGCWAPSDGPSASVTCVIPIEGSRSAEALTIARGVVVTRQRLDASGRPHSIDGNGCRGSETVNWSNAGKRVYVHTDFTCGSSNTPGSSAGLFAISNTGEWIRVEKTRSGSGAIVTTTQLRPTGMSSALTVDVIRSIEGRQRAITAARAAAAVPITTDEILDAVNNLDGDVVRAWLLAGDQTWNVDAVQLVALQNAGVPTPILLVVGGAAMQTLAPVVAVAAPAPVQIVYDEPPVMTTMRSCAPYGCPNPNRYSAFNGWDMPSYPGFGFPPTFPYPYPYSPFGFGSPFGLSTPIITTNTNVGNDRGRSHHGKDGRNWGNGWNNGWNNGGNRWNGSGRGWTPASVGGTRGGSGGGTRGGGGRGR